MPGPKWEGENVKFKEELYRTIPLRVREIAEGEGERDEKLHRICELLKYNFYAYDWVGIYMTGPSRRDLVLGPFLGETTRHVSIPFGKGVCGRAAEQKETIVVADVSKEENYLACSPKVKSEIVVPVMKHGEVVAQIDIDSHTPSAFDDKDKALLEELAGIIAPLF